MDWADEIEIKIADEYGSHGAVLAADADGMIAAALRKAFSDGEASGERKGRIGGIGEAAALGLTLPKTEGGQFADGYRYAIGTYQDAMLRRASQIEKGQ